MFKWKLGGAFMGVYHTVIGKQLKILIAGVGYCIEVSTSNSRS